MKDKSIIIKKYSYTNNFIIKFPLNLIETHFSSTVNGICLPPAYAFLLLLVSGELKIDL